MDEFSKYEEALIACENAIRIGEDDKTSILRYKKYLLYKVGRTNEADSIVIHKPIHIYSGSGRFIG